MAYRKILAQNLWADGTVTATSEATALPATNTQTPERTKIFRSLAQTANQEIFCDLGSAQACDFAAIANLYRESGLACSLHEGGSGGAPGAYNLVATFPTESADTNVTMVTFSSTTARWWKIRVLNGGVAYRIEAGYIGLGSALSLTAEHAPVARFERVDPSIESSAPGGQKSFTELDMFYIGTSVFHFVLEADATRFHTLWTTVGRRIPFFYALDTDIGNQQWLMRITSTMPIERRGGAVPIYAVAFNWEEAR